MGGTSGLADRDGTATGIAALAGLAALIWLVGLAGAAADAHRGALGAVLAQSRVAVALAFVLVGFVAHHTISPAAAAGDADGGPSGVAVLRRHVRWWVLAVVPAAWTVVLVGYLFPPATGAARPTTAFGTGASGASSVPFADLGRGLTFTQPYRGGGPVGPVAHLWPVAAVLAFVLLVVPAVAWASRRLPPGRAWWLLLAVGCVAPAYRGALVLEHLVDVGRLTVLPAHLDALAVGFALGLLADPDSNDGRLGRVRAALRVPLAPVAGAVLALALELGVAAFLGSRLTAERTDGSGVLGHLALVAAAAALAAPVLLRPRRVRGRAEPSRFGDAHTRWAGAVVGIAYATFLWGPVVLGRWVARHPDRHFDLPVAATISWTVAVTAVVAFVSWFALQRPWLRYRDRPMGWFAGGLWAIGLASFASRLWAFGTASVTARNPGNGDPFYYHSQANMLADGVGFGEPIQWITEGRFVASAIHPPLFTLWLTPTSLLGARSFLSHKVMAGLAGVAVVVVAGLLARRLAGERAGLLAAALVALSPGLWIVDGTLWPEGLYTALVGLALLSAYRWRDGPSLGRAAAVGAAVGAAILTRGEAVFLLPFLCLPLALTCRREARPWLAHASVMAAVALAVVAPWTLRNLAAFDKPVPVSTNSEEVLYYANCPDVYRGPLIGWWSFNCQERARSQRVAEGLPKDPPGDEAERASGWGELGRRYALDHKDRWPAVALARATRVWDLRHADTTARLLSFEGRPYDWSVRALWAHRLTLLPGLVGLVVLWRRRGPPAWPLVAMLGVVTLTAVAVYGHVRFRTVGDLVLLVGAAIAVDAVLPGRCTIPAPGPR